MTGKNKKTEQEYFDLFYTKMATDAYENTPALKKISEIIFKRVIDSTTLRKTDTILSLGCANGRFELKIAPLVHKVIGLDISTIAIKNAQNSAEKLAINNAEFLTVDITKGLPFKKNSFDKIFALGTLHHIKNADLVFEESYRLLKNKGLFYLIDPNSNGILRKIGKRFFKRIYLRSHSPEEQDVDYKDFIEKGQRAGFKLEKLEFLDFLALSMAFLIPKLPVFVLKKLISFDKIWCNTPFIKYFSSSFILFLQKTEKN